MPSDLYGAPGHAAVGSQDLDGTKGALAGVPDAAVHEAGEMGRLLVGDCPGGVDQVLLHQVGAPHEHGAVLGERVDGVPLAGGPGGAPVPYRPDGQGPGARPRPQVAYQAREDGAPRQVWRKRRPWSR
jgi:hypothetical protein